MSSIIIFKMFMPFNPEILLLGIHSKKVIMDLYKKTTLQQFLIIAKSRYGLSIQGQGIG